MKHDNTHKEGASEAVWKKGIQVQVSKIENNPSFKTQPPFENVNFCQMKLQGQLVNLKMEKIEKAVKHSSGPSQAHQTRSILVERPAHVLLYPP